MLGGGGEIGCRLLLETGGPRRVRGREKEGGFFQEGGGTEGKRSRRVSLRKGGQGVSSMEGKREESLSP